ncbi:NRT1/PTR family protein 2.2 [Quillaja saponaria]|uniref:NRT1/PTR family protein 2.2 n=1 Tax=Quillaja saponaria TaxID=32244 RepID=A0AAD7LAI5_QUISA|nr:NRT1/PTR family protein 2.2 [Quillaja saponaria]
MAVESWFLRCKGCFSSSSSMEKELNDENFGTTLSDCSTTIEKKPGGWRAMPFILGNETFERLAGIGLLANFMVYLTRELHMDQVTASNVLNIWSGISNFGPLIGAFISDAYVGRFKTIAFASCASFLGMFTVTLTAWLPELHPPPCAPHELAAGIAQVVVAAYKKRKVELPVDNHMIYYDPPLKGNALSKLPLTNQFRFLNKAALTMEGELNPDGTAVNPWRLCSIQQVEEIKCLIRIMPVWAAGIISLTSMAQQGTFTVSQALKMDRHLGHKFQIPAGSLGVISLITIGLWVPFYDRILVPKLRKFTKHEGGITLLQRIGIGNVFSILAMVVAGLVEKVRRDSANMNPNELGVAPLSVWWLAPQLILMGFCEAFNIIGQIEFFNREFPEHMRSIANSIFSCTGAGASYVSSLVVTIVHHSTRTQHRPDWLTNDINAGRLDYFYYVIAGLCVFNLVYFVYAARYYNYKSTSHVEFEDKPHHDDVELVGQLKT